MAIETVLQLKCSCNEYPWGKVGKDSLAARLCEQTPGTDFKIDDSKYYSEMWFGTYPELNSFILSSGEPLQEYMNKHSEELIGKNVLNKFGKDLPFLPKVLSIQKALPLQVHPNKDLAAKLHKEDPENFTDPNHKPEIAVTLTDFEAFVGWKPIQEIQSIFSLDPLKCYLDGPNTEINDKTLKKLVGKILKDSDENIEKVQEELKKLPKSAYKSQGYIHDLIPRLQEQYEATDPGTLVALLTMNYLKLPKDRAIYIPADGIHAYLAGDIIECMARSNNVLNVGFCPRPERNNPDLFMSTLTYAPHSAEECVLQYRTFDRSGNGHTKIIKPPMAEFNMLMTRMESKGSEINKAVGGPSTLIVTKGEGKMKAGGKTHELKTGYVFFVGQSQEIEYETDSNLEVYRAFAE